MTIDEAIKYADMLSCNVNAFEVSKQFGAMCADALRLAKKMSEDAGISATPAQDTWRERRKRESHDDGLVVFDATVDDMQVFNTMCANALRKMQEANKKPKGENAVPETWQRRMQREYHETKERYDKLNRLLVKHAAGTLDFTLKCPIELLKAQCEHMSDYLYTLEIRAEIEGVNLYD